MITPRLTSTIDLEAFDIVKLHLVSRRLRDTTRDSKLWKRRCFEDSNSAATQRRRDLQFIAPSLARETARVFELQRRARALTVRDQATARCPDQAELAETRALANWDPSYASERIDWYEEYVARHAPISMCRLQQPADSRGWNRETKGLSSYVKNNRSLIVAPLDDDSVCVWEAGQQDDPMDSAAGAIVGRSDSCLLTTKLAGGFPKTANRARINIAEVVSVDSAQNKAYIAVHNILTEVDLETLRISSSEEYPFPLSALSEASHPVPLTVATIHSLHLHDPRQSRNACFAGSDQSGRVEYTTTGLPPFPRDHNDLRRSSVKYDTDNYVHLNQPGPLSIAHVPSSTGRTSDSDGHICVAGRFPSILTYNRRMFPRLSSTIHSGSRLASLTSLPYPLLCPTDNTPSHPQTMHTLIACGEYNGKGSLELFPFSTTSQRSPPIHPTSLSFKTPAEPAVPYKNRTSASSSKLLSVIPHGTRIVFSDSDGGLKWVERDGHTLVRRWNLNAYNASTVSAPDPAASQMFASHDGGSVARKILPLGSWEEPKGELAVWTGERIGILGFRPKPRFEWEWDQAEVVGTEETEFRTMMRRALERDADNARIVRGLGLGR